MLTAIKGYFDGQNVVLEGTPDFPSGRRVIVIFLQDAVQEKAANQNKKLSALKRLNEMDFSLPEDFDADKAREDTMKELYGFVS